MIAAAQFAAADDNRVEVAASVTGAPGDIEILTSSGTTGGGEATASGPNGAANVKAYGEALLQPGLHNAYDHRHDFIKSGATADTHAKEGGMRHWYHPGSSLTFDTVTAAAKWAKGGTANTNHGFHNGSWAFYWITNVTDPDPQPFFTVSEYIGQITVR